MKRCPVCQSETLHDGAEYCEECGSLMGRPDGASAEAHDDDFVVTERQDEDREFAGGYRARTDRDELGIQTGADLVQAAALAGRSLPSEDEITGPPSGAVATATITETETAKSGRLTPEQIRSIERKLHDSEGCLTEDEKDTLLRTLAASGARPRTAGGDANLPRPAMAKRGRGVAYFFRNYIQLQGHAELEEQSEIQIADRLYVLKKKSFSTKAIAGTAIAATLVLFALLLPILAGHSSGTGQVVGLAFGEDQQPYAQGATVRFTDVGESYVTNAEGFFKTGSMAPGSHKIEYLVDGKVVGVDYATVTAGDVTTILLKPAPLSPGASAAVASAEIGQPPVDEPTIIPPAQPPVAAPQTSNTVRPATVPEYGKLTLAANVDGAILSLDGAVLGAGNLTYSRVKPGTHAYAVTKEGYESVMGSVTVPAGAVQRLAVSLPQVRPSTPAPASALSSGMSELQTGNMSQAIASFSEAITADPGNSQAYLGRAQAYSSRAEKKAAHDDYLRAAEILRLKGDYGASLTAFNNAIQADPKSVTALLGRADLHMARHEDMAALADYDAVLGLDKRNAQANLGVGIARYGQGNYDLALKYLKEARGAAPSNPAVYQYLMLSYLGSGDIKNVRKSYEKFKEVAGQEQLARFRADKGNEAVVRIVSTGE